MGDQATLCAGVSVEIDKELLRCKILESVQDMKTAYIYIPLREITPPKLILIRCMMP